MNIVLLGSGNVATHLALALKASGENIVQVFSRNFIHATAVAEQVNAIPVNHIPAIIRNADLYIIAVKDDAVEEVVHHLSGIEGLVVHTSGTLDLKVISSVITNAGVFYPLQTFSKHKEISFKTIPLCLEASDNGKLEILNQLAQKLSDTVYIINSGKRKILHLAAVFACNFTNHLYALSNQILAENDLNFDMIRPLILETADKAMVALPADVQTGPALRNDEHTINKHLAMLADLPELQEIYKIFSNSIKLMHQ